VFDHGLAQLQINKFFAYLLKFTQRRGESTPPLR